MSLMTDIGRGLDSLIGIFAPGYQLQRAMARDSLGTVQAAGRSYDLARPGDRKLMSWRRPQTSGRSAVAGSLPILRNSARDLTRNNPYAANMVRVMVGSLVGYGITAKPRVRAKNKRSAIVKAWSEFGRHACAEGTSTFDGFQVKAATQFFEVGEVFVRIRVRDRTDANRIGLKFPMQLQMLESEQLPMESWTHTNGNRVIQGIEIDAIGSRVAYHFFRSHPSDTETFSMEKVRVPAAEIIHIFNPTRAGQMRGVPPLTPAAGRLRHLDEYNLIEIIRAKTQAGFAGFVERSVNSPVDSADGTIPDPALGGVEKEETDDEARLERIEPGQINYLRAGESVKFSQPPPPGQTEPFTREQLRAAAVGMGCTPEQATGDMSQTTYSSWKGGSAQHRKYIETLQWTLFIPMFLERVWAEFIALGRLLGRWADEEVPVDWGVPLWPSIEPAKEAAATVTELAAGLKSYQQVCADRGEDWQDMIDQQAEVWEYVASRRAQLAPTSWGKVQSGNIAGNSSQPVSA